MPRAKIPKHPPAPARPPESDVEFSEEINDDIEQFFSSQSDQSVASVYRVGKPGERDAFLDSLSIAALRNPGPEQVIRDTFGPGHYYVRLRAADVRGKYRLAGSKIIMIGEGAKPAAAGNGAGLASHPDSYLREELNRQQSILLALIAANKPQTVDFAGIAAMIAALSPGNKQSDLGAVVAAFTSLKQAADPQTGLTQVKEVLEIAKSISGGDRPRQPAGKRGIPAGLV